jgi:GNAT superfamily N-acetyltransferase
MTSDSAASSSRPLADGVEIRDARPEEAEELLPLMRAYCDFYDASPPDQGLLEMARILMTDPEEGAMFIARAGGKAVGFATLDWKWSSLKAAKLGYLEDLYVVPDSRGGGIADALIEACAERCRERGAPAMQWLTAPDNHRAQAVYERTGAEADTYLEYDLGL